MEIKLKLPDLPKRIQEEFNIVKFRHAIEGEWILSKKCKDWQICQTDITLYPVFVACKKVDKR